MYNNANIAILIVGEYHLICNRKDNIPTLLTNSHAYQLRCFMNGLNNINNKITEINCKVRIKALRKFNQIQRCASTHDN